MIDYQKQYYVEHKQQRDAQSRNWRINNRERYNELQRRWRKENPNAVKKHILKNKEWRKNNPEKVRAMKNRHYFKHKSEILKKTSAWSKQRRKDPEYRAHQAELAKLWVKNNIDRVRANHRRWRKENKEKLRPYAIHHTYVRRARQRQNTINPQSILIFVRGIKSRPTAICYYCKKTVSTKRIHFEHIIPLAKGGSHSVENLCVSCAPCNMHKHDKLIQDWFRLGQQLLSL